MAIDLIFPVRIAQIVLAIIELGLTGYVAGVIIISPDQINFMIFNSVWSILVAGVLLLAPRLDANGRHIGHKFVVLALDALTALFWFAGFIALSVSFGNPNCSGFRVCECIKAACAFGAFLWLLFTVTAVLDALHVFSNRGHRTSKAAPELSHA